MSFLPLWFYTRAQRSCANVGGIADEIFSASSVLLRFMFFFVSLKKTEDG